STARALRLGRRCRCPPLRRNGEEDCRRGVLRATLLRSAASSSTCPGSWSGRGCVGGSFALQRQNARPWYFNGDKRAVGVAAFQINTKLFGIGTDKLSQDKLSRPGRASAPL